MDFKSITNSTYRAEGLDALQASKSVHTKNELKENLTINMNSKLSRATCWYKINKRYLAYDEKGKIIASPLLRLIDFEDQRLNREIMYFHYLYQESLAQETILKLIYPRLLSEGSYILERQIVKNFVRNYLLNYSIKTIDKTANSIVKALIDFQIVQREGKNIRISFYDPSLASFLYGFYAEYSPGFEAAHHFKILNPSLEHIRKKSHFYKLLLIKPSMLRAFLDLAWKKNFVIYEPRGGLDQYVLSDRTLNGLTDHLLTGGD